MEKVSVVIPVYNGKAYLRQCLDSVCGQTLREIEIICVDDGSTDSSPAILEEYRMDDPRIRVIRQENQRAAAARNNGLAHAQGKYVMFWDCDDFFEPNALELLYNRAEETEADICVCGGDLYYEENGKIYPNDDALILNRVPEGATFNRLTNPEHILSFTNAVVWNKLFRRDFLKEKELKFPNYTIGEDRELLFLALCEAERVTVLDKILIHYRWNNPQSIMGRSSGNPRENLLSLASVVDQLRERDILPENYGKKALQSVIQCLHKVRTGDDFIIGMQLLREEGLLEKFDIREREPGYYYAPIYDEYVKSLLHDAPGDVLAFLMHDAFERQRVVAADKRRLRNRVSELSVERRELKAELGKTKAALEELQNSRSYKLSKALMYLPNKIRALLRGLSINKKAVQN